MKDNSPRRIWQFSLKGLLILMLIVAGYRAGWAAMRRVRLAEERARVAAAKARALTEFAVMQGERTQAALAVTWAKAAAGKKKRADEQSGPSGR